MSPTGRHSRAAAERQQIAEDVERLSERIDEHEREDTKRYEEITAKLGMLLRYRAQLRTLLAILVFVLGGLGLTAKWMIKHALQDVLAEHGIIEVRRK